ncbi:acid--amino-acid ligase [Trypanosoma conorhini]|uniref:Acid--amino-acid ligase n=1 Tax=Trypanosoma conorhini TaxID=83891 RepID=A0A422PWE5_9TRYP|nr:acid--amino-acid ligase [Trypanosoma conorhini]RNF22008.1 acid--amino-acid ligase [Trypanosoma conorhini]
MELRGDAVATARRDALHRTLYLRREYALVARCGEFDDVLLVPPQNDSGRPGDCWRGLVAVRGFPSPWYRGVFSFLVWLPPKYPFEAPSVRLETPLKSHPLLLDDGEGRRCVVPFDDIYVALDPMRVSVMARLLHHVRSIFFPSDWAATTTPAPPVNKALARHDVERRSVTQEVVLGKPYVDYLSREAVAFFSNPDHFKHGDARMDASGAEEAWEKAFSLWLGRSWLPAVRLLQ